MKHQCSMRRLTITGGSEKAVRVSRRMDCRFGVIKSHVSDNNKNVYVSWLMCHVYKFMCYLFVELKLKINIRSLFNRTLNRAHPPLLCCALLALRSIQLMTGEPRPRYNALQLLGVIGACGLGHEKSASGFTVHRKLSRGDGGGGGVGGLLLLLVVAWWLGGVGFGGRGWGWWVTTWMRFSVTGFSCKVPDHLFARARHVCM